MPDSYDFARSLPPVPERLGPVLSDAMAAVAAMDLALIGRASSMAGREADRNAAAAWLAPRLGRLVGAERIIPANGTQSVVAVLLQALVGPRKRLAAEVLSYGMLRRLTEISGVQVTSLPIDEDGLDVDALEHAARAGDIGALYCNPTFHNPTAIVMSVDRRKAVAEIARRYDIAIIEDDPLGLLYPHLPPPIAAFAPERTWHVVTLTKTIAQGMRIAYLVTPTDRVAAGHVLEPFSRLSHWAAAPIMLAAATWMIDTSHAQEIRDTIAAENIARLGFAKAFLPEATWRCVDGSPHLWIPLEGDKLDSVTVAFAEAGILARRETMFAVDDRRDRPTGLRLSLSSPLSRDIVREGLMRAGEIVAAHNRESVMTSASRARQV